jgi:hypothetical protein
MSNSTTHNFTSDYFSQIQSILVIEYLPTNLNITFNIADFPTRQLAEATITIDNDANRVYWYKFLQVCGIDRSAAVVAIEVRSFRLDLVVATHTQVHYR